MKIKLEYKAFCYKKKTVNIKCFPPMQTCTVVGDSLSETTSIRDWLHNRVGAVVRVLAFHQCVPGSIPGPSVICGLSLLVLYFAPRGLSPDTPVFPSPQKPTFDLLNLFDLIYLIYSLPN